jgi:hypothetical protein
VEVSNPVNVVPPLFGDGSDGDFINAGTTTAIRDMYFNTFLNPVGQIYQPANYKIACRVSFRNFGTVRMLGTAGANGTALAGGVGGTAIITTTQTITGTVGGAGGGVGLPGTAGTNQMNGIGGAGGTGGIAGGGAAGGVGGTCTPIANGNGGPKTSKHHGCLGWHPLLGQPRRRCRHRYSR